MTVSASTRLDRRFLHFLPLWRVLVFFALLGLLACGGGSGSGGGGGGGTAPPAPTNLTATAASSSQINLSWTGSARTASYSVYRSTTSGFTPSSSNQIATGVAEMSYSDSGLSASTTYYYVAEAVNSAGSSGPSNQASATTQAGGGGGGSFAAGRTKYVRTDATTEYFGWINSHWVVYNPTTNRFFVTDPYSNHVMVMDPASETEITAISVPGAYAIDDTPDHSTLYVGTLIGDVYAIDPVGMTVKQRYIASQIGPYGYSAMSAVVMADGRLALLGQAGGIPSVDGSNSVAIWNPSNNSFGVLYGAIGSISGVPGACGDLLNIGGFSRTVDRTNVIITSIDSDATLCEIDETTSQGIYTGTGASFTMVNFRTTPDGKYIIVPKYPGGANVYDAQTLQPLPQVSVSGDTSTASGFFISPDSTTLYAPSSTIIYAYDLATGEQTGWLPNMDVQNENGGGAEGPITAPNVQATDGTGLFVGPLEEGVGFVDIGVMRTGTVGTQFTNGYLSPATGSMSGGTAVQLPDPNPVGPLSAMFFGSQHATNLSYASGIISATTPAENSGPADVWTFTTDGGFQLLPEGFSYGPTILEVSPNMSTAEGGGTGYIFGYGFGPVGYSTVIPSSLQIKVGGMATQITAFVPYAYPNSAPPFPLQSVAFTIPPGTAGSADVSVTSSSGSATATASLTYLPAVQQFPLASSTLAQGIYDPYQDLYYFTDASQIQVFSNTQGKWLSPIRIPSPNGATQRLWGLALSPDGSKLAVADVMAGVIYVLDPANPGSVETFSVSTLDYTASEPVGVAINNAGMVYFTAMTPGVTGAHGFYKLNTNTGATTDYGVDNPGLADDVLLRTVISADNSRVFFNDDGYVFNIDTATDKIFSASTDQGCCYGDYDLTLSANQVQFSASSYIYDSNLNAESFYSLNDREILTAAWVYGAKLSRDGTLLFQPSTNGVDVLDGRLGNLLHRISLPVALSQNYDALVADGKDNVLIAITGVNGNGIAVVDLTSVQEPPPVPFVNRSLRKANRLVPWGRSRLGSRKMSSTSTRGQSPQIVPRSIPRVTTPSVRLK
jgi:Fibronectin type III domain/IPT/TIG domain